MDQSDYDQIQNINAQSNKEDDLMQRYNETFLETQDEINMNYHQFI